MKVKKLLALALCLLMTVSLLPVSAWAEGEDPAAAVAASDTEPAGTPEETPDRENPAQLVEAEPAPQEEDDGPAAKDGDTYTVAGTPGAFTTSWDPTDTSNDLTANGDGTYSKKFHVNARQEATEFKVVKNHSWDTSWPGENYRIKLIGAGDFTITFDPATGTVSTSGDIVYWPDEPEAFYVAGTWNSWNATGTPMTRLDHYVWKAEVDLDTGVQAFKFTQGTWDNAVGADASYTYAAFGQPYDTGTADDIQFHANSGHYKIVYDMNNGKYTVSRRCSVTVIQPAGGTLSASTASGYSGTVVTLNSDPAAASYAANGTALEGNTYTLSNEDVTFTATYASGQTYTFTDTSNSDRGTSVVLNASNQIVTSASAGEMLHLQTNILIPGYVACFYSARYGSQGARPAFEDRPIDEPFEMPENNVYYSITYFPEQSGYYWYLRTNPQPIDSRALILSQVLSEDGDSGYYIAPTQLNSTGWLNVRYYDADTHKLGTNYQHTVTSSETGDVFVRLLPAGGVVSVARAITVVQPQQGGTISTLSCASANDTVTVYTTADTGYRFDSLTVTDANGNPVTVYGTVFTMPSSSVTVTATFVPDPLYPIHVQSTAHGTTTVSITGSYQNATEAQARKGTYVAVDTTPDQGYKKRTGSLTVLPSATGGYIPGISKVDGETTTSFYMPGQEVWVSVTYVIANAGYYLCFKEDGRQVGTSIYYSIPESAIDPRNLYEDASGSMYLTVAIPAAWAGKEAWTTYVNGNGEVWNLDTQNGGGVTIPADAAGKTVRFHFQLTNRGDGYPKYVTGTTTLENSYGITAAATTNGALVVAESAFAGDSVTVTATPANGYYLRRLTVTDAGNNPVTVTNGAFTMPAGPVTVTATFAQEVPLSDGFYIVPEGEDDLTNALPMANRSDVIERLFSYTGNLTAGTYSLVKVIGHAPVEYDYNDENWNSYPTTELPFTVASSGKQTVYIKASNTVVNASTEVYRQPKCLSLTGLYCWASAVHDWEFANIKASDAFVYDSSTGFYIASTRLSGYDRACVVELSNGNFVRSYPADAFPNYTAGNNVFYVADGDEFGYGGTIPAVMYYRADGQGDAAEGWQQGCLKAERQYDVVVNPYTHGTVTVSKTAGLLIGLTVEPDAGYRLSGLTVVDADNNPIAVTHSEDMDTLYEFRIASSNAYVTVQFTEDADYYVYTQAMANGNTLPDAAYKMAYVYDNTAEIGYFTFVQKSLLAVGDSIHIVKVENGAITAHYPNDSYWMPLTAENLDDETTGTEIGFRPEGFDNTSFANDAALVFEDGSADKLFYKCLYATIVINSHSITLVADAAACTVVGLPESADAGATVTFTVTPAANLDPSKMIRVTAQDTTNNAVVNVTPGENNTYSFTMPAGNVTVTAQAVTRPVVIRNAKVYFDGTIHLSFGFQADTLPAGGKVRLTKAGTNNTDPVEVAVADGRVPSGGDGSVVEFYLPVMIPEFADLVTAQVLDADGELLPIESQAGTSYGTGFTYSVWQYAVNMKDSTTASPQMRALAKALLDYGTAAQIYFTYGDYENLTVSAEAQAVTAQDLADYAMVTTPSADRPVGVKASIRLYFEADNTLKITYSGLSGDKTYTYTLDGDPVTPPGSYLYAANIAAPNLDVSHVFAISDGEKTFSITASALTYALNSINSGDPARQNLGKALYLYNQAANAFFENNNN